MSKRTPKNHKSTTDVRQENEIELKKLYGTRRLMSPRRKSQNIEQLFILYGRLDSYHQSQSKYPGVICINPKRWMWRNQHKELIIYMLLSLYNHFY